tara:strand:+ start:522 stop:683 length:162 start_codon:yes stop_codon:yes gene_type:complete
MVLARCLNYYHQTTLKLQIMKNEEQKSAAVKLMLSATLQEYLVYIQNLSPKVC